MLAKHASCAGNFTEVTEQVLGKISADNAKLTYSHGSYLFHYITEDTITFLCITDDDFERSKAFSYLSDVKRRFRTQYGARAKTALPFAMNSEFSRVLSAQMRHCSGGEQSEDKISQVEGQVDELKGIMVKNIDAIADRGEKLELLIDKTEDLQANSISFKTTSRGLARSMWWKNMKITIIVVIVIILVIYFIVSAACGGLDWPCTKN